MSASREKKQRQGEPAQGLTQKQIQERKEAAVKKRNTIIYTVIGVVVAVLVAALLVWNSGFFQSRTVAMTINGRDYSPAEVSFYYGGAKQEYGYYLSMMGYDSSKSDREQVLDEEKGQTFYDLFLEDAKKSMIRTTALADAARAENMTLSEENQKLLEETIAGYETAAAQNGLPTKGYLRAYFGRYMTEKVLRSCLEENLLANQYYTEHSDSLTYDAAALEEYYTENAAALDTFVYNTIFFDGSVESTEDEEGNTVEPTEEEKAAGMKAAKEKADAFLAQAEEDGFQAAADAAKAEDESLTYDGETRNLGSRVSATLMDWLSDSARKEGDISVIEYESGNGYYVVQFVERFRNEEDFGSADIRHILVKAEVAESEKEASEEAMNAAKEKAQEILDQFNAGDKTAESFAALAKEHSEDPGSKDNGGLYEDVDRNTGFFTDFKNWIFADGRKAGDTGLVENTQSGQQGWHVMYLDSTGETLWKYTAENALRAADLQTWEEGLQEGYEATDGSGAQYLG